MASPPTDDEAERPSNQDTISKIGFHYMGFWRNSLQFLRVFRNQYPKNGPKLILSRATWASSRNEIFHATAGGIPERGAKEIAENPVNTFATYRSVCSASVSFRPQIAGRSVAEDLGGSNPLYLPRRGIGWH